MESHTKAIESTRNLLTAAASVAATAMLVRTFVDSFLPHQLRDVISSRFHSLRASLSTDHSILIQDSRDASSHQLFHACKTYLSSKFSSSSSRFKAAKLKDRATITFYLEEGQELIDVFQGIDFRWRLLRRNSHRTMYIDGRPKSFPHRIYSFELFFHKKHKDTAIGPYLHYVIQHSDSILAVDRSLKLHSNKNAYWLPQRVDLQHPATFEKLAMESEMKQTIVEDLAKFMKNKEHYKKIGTPWIRSYLIYGRSGTGKSSLVVAMAKYLSFDIYDLNFKEVRWNVDLKLLLLGLSNRSILLIEDIDCLIDRPDRGEKKEGSEAGKELSITGLLSFVDGLWSCTGEGRVVIFTTRDLDCVDPALLQPGRIDLRIPMGFCNPSGFRTLASNYHGVPDHWRFEEIEELMREVKVTPAEVSEELLRSEDADTAMDGLIQFLHRKKWGGGDEIAGDSCREGGVQVGDRLRRASPSYRGGRGGRPAAPGRGGGRCVSYRGRGSGRRGRVFIRSL